MVRPAFLLAVMLLAAGAASAQTAAAPPVEHVTVTGARTRQAVEAFVQSLAQPTRATGKIARWQDGICPVLVGLKHEFAAFITGHMKEVAAKAGAPVNRDPSCAPNIVIIFTTTPQALLDNIRRNQPGYLGYYDNHAQLDALAKVDRPIQSWYVTATMGVDGKVEIDSGNTLGAGLEIYLPCPEQPGGCPMRLSNAHAATVTGNRLGDGLRSGLHHVIIVANPDRLVEYEMGTLSDYIAMLGLAAFADPSACQQLPTILNLMARDCPNAPTALTDNDQGYLGALYKMSPDRAASVERDEMTFEMQKSLGVP